MANEIEEDQIREIRDILEDEENLISEMIEKVEDEKRKDDLKRVKNKCNSDVQLLERMIEKMEDSELEREELLLLQSILKDNPVSEFLESINQKEKNSQHQQ